MTKAKEILNFYQKKIFTTQICKHFDLNQKVHSLVRQIAKNVHEIGSLKI